MSDEQVVALLLRRPATTSCGMTYFKASYLPAARSRSRTSPPCEKRLALPRSPGPLQHCSPVICHRSRRRCTAELRIDRHVAALRVIEAIRLHAAAHDGAARPSRWIEITEVPVPEDPATGEPFDTTATADLRDPARPEGRHAAPVARRTGSRSGAEPTHRRRGGLGEAPPPRLPSDSGPLDTNAISTTPSIE